MVRFFFFRLANFQRRFSVLLVCIEREQFEAGVRDFHTKRMMEDWAQAGVGAVLYRRNLMWWDHGKIGGMDGVVLAFKGRRRKIWSPLRFGY